MHLVRSQKKVVFSAWRREAEIQPHVFTTRIKASLVFFGTLTWSKARILAICHLIFLMKNYGLNYHTYRLGRRCSRSWRQHLIFAPIDVGCVLGVTVALVATVLSNSLIHFHRAEPMLYILHPRLYYLQYPVQQEKLGSFPCLQKVLRISRWWEEH